MVPSPTDELRAFSIDVVRQLRAAGHVAFWAGGCVRDLLLNRPSKDYDVATDARPEQVRRLFRRTVAVGESFGVVRVIGGRGRDVEVATFRADGDYSDGRRPDSVSFSSPIDDARRRDFTINGLFFDPITEEVHDYVGGREDIQRRILRAIGDPLERFREDKLRLLRAARFVADLGFELDPSTRDAARVLADRIHEISSERILMELRRMLAPPTRATAVELLLSLNLFPHVLPELRDLPEDAARWETTLRVLAHWPHEALLGLAVAGLFATYPVEQARSRAAQMLDRLRASNEDKDHADWLIAHREDFLTEELRPPHVLKRLFAHRWVQELFEYARATAQARSGAIDAVERVHDLFASLPAEAIDPPPLLNGRDLIACGLEPGPLYSRILEQIRNEQLDGRLTTPEAAIQRAKEFAGKG